MTKVFRYHPKLGFVGGEPKPNGGSIRWSSDTVLDWSSGLLVPIEMATAPQVDKEGKKYKRPIPGLRTRTLKSSSTVKYHVGGPYNGAKLRKWIKASASRDNKRMVEILPDTYTVPPFKGRYEFNHGEDRYEWQD